ncbi:MAG: LysM peptidoglycan-binding domain-containing protein [Rhodobacteraceae bacterium]|nr:LysM peptidoglycan-binding domain-containing protein [Paracoccaceae bacterium]
MAPEWCLGFREGAGRSPFGGSAEAAEVPREQAIRREMAGQGLDTSGLDIRVSADTASVSGTAASREGKEMVILVAGKVVGAARVEEDIAGEDPVLHTVKKGDTLSAIARATLGRASRSPRIPEASKPVLRHPDTNRPGQVPRIPKALAGRNAA